jgi:internalin A
MDKLNYLILKSNNLTNIEFISKFRCLSALDLSFNNIRNIDKLSILINLTYISLSNNQIEDISGLTNLKNLHTLYLNHNNLFDISSVQNMPLLFRLEVNSNSLTNINAIKNLNRLQIFDSSNNQIETIEDNLFDEIFLLKKLDLSNNRIKMFKSTLNQTKIYFLNMSYNQLMDINFIYNCSKLKQAFVNNNNITRLSFNNFLNYIDLFRFDLSFNRISLADEKIDLSKNEFLRYFFIDICFIKHFSDFNNSIIVKQYESVRFIKSLFILTKDNISFFDCKLTFNFIKRNIHFNLFYSHQVERFISICQLSDFV